MNTQQGPHFPARHLTAGIAGVLALAAPPSAALGETRLPEAPVVAAPDQEGTTTSILTKTVLPKGAIRLPDANVPDSVHKVLTSLVKAGGDKVYQGKSEVLAWTGENFKTADFAAMRAKFGSDLKAGGWTYTEDSKETKENPFTLVTVLRTAPTRRGLIGVWAHNDDTLMLAWTEIQPVESPKPAEEPADDGEHSIKGIFDSLQPKWVVTPPLPEHLREKLPTASRSKRAAAAAATAAAPSPSASAATFVVAPSQVTVNVMKNALPPIPVFGKLAPRRGVVRGFVKDTKGRPLSGAVIGVRSSSAGGFYSGATAKSDAKGYYEIAAPWGAGEFYTASITRDYGDGRAAFGLHPADGEADTFATANGAVENWVLLPYGVADRGKASDQPQYHGNYYGGTFTINYFVMDARFPDNTSLPDGSEVAVTLTPVGPLIDGSKGKTLVIRSRVQESSRTSFYVNNVPIGAYRVTAVLHPDGPRTPLTIRETGPASGRPFGLEPKEGRDVVLTFRPGSAKAGIGAAAQGNWESLQITLTR